MIRLTITEELHKRAEDTAQDIPSFKMSHRGGPEANIIGCLGEYIIEDWMRSNDIFFNDEREETTHDYRLLNGETFDVKTKDRTFPMRRTYACSISDYNAEHQRPKYYFFVSLQRDDPKKDKKDKKNIENHENNDIRRFHTAFIVGGVRRSYFKKHSVGWKVGQIDPSNNWPVGMDCHNLDANKVQSPQNVIKKLKEISPANN